MKNIKRIVLAVLLLAVLCASVAFAENISIVNAGYKDGVLSWSCSNQFYYEVYVDGSAVGLEGDWTKGSVTDLNLSAGEHTLKLVDVTNGSDSKTFTVAGAAVETATPTVEPTAEPTVEPTVEPTAEPTVEPTAEPSVEPTAEPTNKPTTEPTNKPTTEPTNKPTTEPTKAPVADNTDDTDVPKTGDTRVSYVLVVGMIVIAAGILLARRFGHEK